MICFDTEVYSKEVILESFTGPSCRKGFFFNLCIPLLRLCHRPRNIHNGLQLAIFLLLSKHCSKAIG